MGLHALGFGAEALFSRQSQLPIDAFAAMGIRVIDNTSEELRELVVEMMDRVEGRHTEVENERTLQACFARLAAADGVYRARIARAFMSRHRDLFSA
jgi:hypothetical protein